MSKKRMSNNVKVWIVAVGAILMAICTVIPGATTLSLYTVPLSEGLGVSRTEVSLMFSISAFSGIVAALLVGPLLKKLPNKLVVIIGGIFLFIYFAAVSLAPNMMVIYIAVVFKGVGNMFSGMAMAQIVIAEWFDKSRGKVMSFVSIATSALGAAGTAGIAYLIAGLGYKTAAMGEAIIFGGLIVLIGIFCIDEAPQKIGYLPFGYTKVEKEDPGAAPDAPRNERAALALKEIMKMPAFYIVLLVTFLSTIAAGVFNAHGSPYFQSLGLDAASAGVALSIYNLSGIAWNFIFGAVSDKFGAGKATVINGICVCVGTLLAFMWTGWVGAIIFAILFQANGSISTLLGPLLSTGLFGTKEAGTLVGTVRACAAMGSVVGPIFAGMLFDMMGNYVMVMEILGVITVIVILLTLYASSKKTRAKVQAKIEELAAAKNEG